MIARFTFAALNRLRSVPRSGWVGTALGVAIGWVGVATLTKAPMDPPVAVGFVWCMFVGIALSLLMGVLLTRFDRHEERLVRLEIRAKHASALPEVLPEAEVEGLAAPRFAKLRSAAEAVNARMQPTFLEPEPPVTEPARERLRPTPSPRDGYVRVGRYDVPVEPLRFPEPEPPATVPMERAWEESAAELTEQQQWEADQEAKYAAAMARIEEMAKGVA